MPFLFSKLAEPAFKREGRMSFQGLSIAIENKKGSVRSGVGKDGKKWRTVMKYPYGYIVGTEGADGDDVDCYVGPDEKALFAFVVHQKKDDGTFDEDKVMLGFGSEEEARHAYLAHYDTPKYLGPISKVPMERLKTLVASDKPLKKIAEMRLEAVQHTAFLDELQKTAGLGFTGKLGKILLSR